MSKAELKAKMETEQRDTFFKQCLGEAKPAVAKVVGASGVHTHVATEGEELPVGEGITFKKVLTINVFVLEQEEQQEEAAVPGIKAIDPMVVTETVVPPVGGVKPSIDNKNKK